MKLTYCKDGIAVPDHQAEEFAMLLVHSNLRVSSELVIHYARALIFENKLYNNVVFEYERDGVVIDSQRCNSNGRFPYWIKGFADHMDDCLDRLLAQRRG